MKFELAHKLNEDDKMALSKQLRGSASRLVQTHSEDGYTIMRSVRASCTFRTEC